MKKEILNGNLLELSEELGGFFNGRASAVKEDGIYQLEHQPSVPGFISYRKVYPHLSELRKDKDFVYACINHFTDEQDDAFLADLCKWFAGNEEKCPVIDFDLFYIPGEFHKEVVFFKNNKPMSRRSLIAAIEKKVREGYVLDHTKMKCDRIAYKNRDYDSIIGMYRPCIVINDQDEVAVDYFEVGEYDSPAEQVGLTSFSDYTLDFIQTPYLHHILYSMVKP